MITTGPKIYLVKRTDGKEIHVRENPLEAMHDYLHDYHDPNWYEVEELSAGSLLWWSPRVKADEWEKYGE